MYVQELKGVIQSLKYLPHNHEDLILILRIHFKNKTKQVWQYMPSVQQKASLWGLLSQQHQ